MKHAEILTTSGQENEAPVLLHLSSNITSLQQVRKAHDEFLKKFVAPFSKNPIQLEGLWWPDENSAIARRKLEKND